MPPIFHSACRRFLAVIPSLVLCLACLQAQASLDYFRASTSGLTFVNNTGYAGVGYLPGAIPDVNPIANMVYIKNSNDEAYANLTLPAGNYIVSSRAEVYQTGDTGFSISAGGTLLTTDKTLAGSGWEIGKLVSKTYPGYFRSSGGSVQVKLHGGGVSVARVNHLIFESTSDVFFDENTSGLSLSGAGTGLFTLTVQADFSNSLLNASGYNAIGISPGGSASANVTLVSGQQYAVYASRQLTQNGNAVAFDISLGGALFQRVTGTANYDSQVDNVAEIFVGYYTPSSNSVSVVVDQPGANAARVDYIRFSEVKTVAANNRTITLNAGNGYSLESLNVAGHRFPSGGQFPTFLLYDSNGIEKYVTGNSGFFTSIQAQNITDGVTVTYSSSAFSASVTYKINPDATFLITVTPLTENTWKIRAVMDNGALLSVPYSASGALQDAYLMRPFQGGEVIKFPSTTNYEESLSDTQEQTWEYNAGFVGLGVPQVGLIIRSPQFGGFWKVGTGRVRGEYSLYMSSKLDFRPRRDQAGTYGYWTLPLPEPSLDLQILPVGDVNADSTINWVDLGVTYRESFIHRNQNLDPYMPGAFIGKLDVGPTFANPQKYDTLINQIVALDFAPQIIWVVGAHTQYDYVAPPHSPAPHSLHNGAGGYDYFDFRQDALAVGARVGPSEVFEDSSPLNSGEWGNVPMRMTEFWGDMSTWWTTVNGSPFCAYSKALRPALADGTFMQDLQTQFAQWQASSGDTWHWDVFTSFCRADFDPDHPVTHGMDYRDRIEVLRQVQLLGIHMTSEGLQEGMAEYCDYAWTTRAQQFFTSQFSGGSGVPMIPVLFQGKTYYSVPAAPAWGLLLGGTTGWEATSIDVPAFTQGYFAHVPYWMKICDRTVKNMVKTTNGWQVTYDQGGTLTVDLTTMDFTLSVDGNTWTPAQTPANPYGYSATLVNGTYVVSP